MFGLIENLKGSNHEMSEALELISESLQLISNQARSMHMRKGEVGMREIQCLAEDALKKATAALTNTRQYISTQEERGSNFDHQRAVI